MNPCSLERLPPLHSGEEALYGCPSGPPLAQFLMVTTVHRTLFHQSVGLAPATGEGLPSSSPIVTPSLLHLPHRGHACCFDALNSVEALM
jgi:hypothetical protein